MVKVHVYDATAKEKDSDAGEIQRKIKNLKADLRRYEANTDVREARRVRGDIVYWENKLNTMNLGRSRDHSFRVGDESSLEEDLRNLRLRYKQAKTSREKSDYLAEIEKTERWILRRDRLAREKSSDHSFRVGDRLVVVHVHDSRITDAEWEKSEGGGQLRLEKDGKTWRAKDPVGYTTLHPTREAAIDWLKNKAPGRMK